MQWDLEGSGLESARTLGTLYSSTHRGRPLWALTKVRRPRVSAVRVRGRGREPCGWAVSSRGLTTRAGAHYRCRGRRAIEAVEPSTVRVCVDRRLFSAATVVAAKSRDDSYPAFAPLVGCSGRVRQHFLSEATIVANQLGSAGLLRIKPLVARWRNPRPLNLDPISLRRKHSSPGTESDLLFGQGAGARGSSLSYPWLILNVYAVNAVPSRCR